jgi:hypothetical protein
LAIVHHKSSSGVIGRPTLGLHQRVRSIIVRDIGWSSLPHALANTKRGVSKLVGSNYD